MSLGQRTAIVISLLTFGGCGGGEAETEIEVVPPTIEEQLIEFTTELHAVACEVLALEEPGQEVDVDRRSELLTSSRKLSQKIGDLLNKNGLSGQEINRLNRTYVQPAVNTRTCGD